jgi:tRNA U34 2-thiouridine synthase MnmA/TrmU
MTRALAMVSGGLDSLLAARLIMDQGIEVIGICFKSAFFGPENAIRMSEQIGMELKVVDFSSEHLEMVKQPKHGYGKNMNPCIDCHAMMMNYTGKLMKEMDADFIITGEVLNQRPMSQTKASLDIVKKESGFDDYILRPLCALNLKPTKMELEGLVDREKLMGISGRSRKVQMELAEKWGIKDYPSPAGGCRLTEPGYAARLKDQLGHAKESNLEDVEILKTARHIRFDENTKIIATRNQEELKVITPLIRKDDYVFDTLDCPGSTVILRGKASTEALKFAAAICARYSKERDKDSVRVKFRHPGESESEIIEIAPAKDEYINKHII